MRARTWLVAVVPLALAGCFEFAADSDFRADGSALITAEIGVSQQLATVLSGQTKPGPADLLGECEKPRPAASLPAGVRSITGKRSQRGDMALCTYVIDVADPVAAAEAQSRAAADRAPGLRGLDRPTLKLERLREGVYRLSATFKPIDDLLPRTGQTAEDLTANAMLLAMSANRYVTLTVSALRIENTTGELQTDGRKVTWKLPLLALVKSMPGTPTEIRADIVYAEGWTTKIRRWLGMDEAPRTAR
ncbi:MAG TPA: hypothetical protein VJ890_25460 [Vineibacter sp.]|nr:hypothetical protein [Vineibacter sp.]